MQMVYCAKKDMIDGTAMMSVVYDAARVRIWRFEYFEAQSKAHERVWARADITYVEAICKG